MKKTANTAIVPTYSFTYSSVSGVAPRISAVLSRLSSTSAVRSRLTAAVTARFWLKSFRARSSSPRPRATEITVEVPVASSTPTVKTSDVKGADRFTMAVSPTPRATNTPSTMV